MKSFTSFVESLSENLSEELEICAFLDFHSPIAREDCLPNAFITRIHPAAESHYIAHRLGDLVPWRKEHGLPVEPGHLIEQSGHVVVLKAISLD